MKDLCYPEKSGVYGIPATAEEFDINKTRYLRISDISKDGKLLHDNKKSVSLENTENYLLEEGDIVFARTGNSTGKTYFHEAKNGELAFAGFLIKFSVNPTLVNPKYLRYYTITNHYREWVQNFSLGSTRGNLNAESFSNCPIPLPSRKQQDFLVKILSALDDKIELNNRINEVLEAKAKLLYDYWFVQFEFPASGASASLSPLDGSRSPLDGSRSPRNGGYKSSGGKMVYNKKLKREIPEGWEVKRLEEIANITMGQSPSGKSYNEYGDGMIFFQGSTDFNWRFPTNRVFTTEPSRLAFEDDILISVRAPVGTMNIAMEDCCIGRGLAAINEKSGNNSFLIYQMNYFQKIFQALNSVGTTFGSLTKDQLFNLELVYPPTEILKSFETKVSILDEKIKVNSKQNQHLASLRDWLLPMLMNGQVGVGKGYEIVEGELGMVAEPGES